MSPRFLKEQSTQTSVGNSLPSQGVGGVSATDEFVIVSSRSADDQQDLFVCLDPVSGAVLWQKEYAAPGQLDYGTSPRANRFDQ